MAKLEMQSVDTESESILGNLPLEPICIFISVTNAYIIRAIEPGRLDGRDFTYLPTGLTMYHSRTTLRV